MMRTIERYVQDVYYENISELQFVGNQFIAEDRRDGWSVCLSQKAEGIYSIFILVDNDPDAEGGCCVNGILYDELIKVVRLAHEFAGRMHERFKYDRIAGIKFGDVSDTFKEFNNFDQWRGWVSQLTT